MIFEMVWVVRQRYNYRQSTLWRSKESWNHLKMFVMILEMVWVVRKHWAVSVCRYSAWARSTATKSCMCAWACEHP